MEKESGLPQLSLLIKAGEANHSQYWCGINEKLLFTSLLFPKSPIHDPAFRKNSCSSHHQPSCNVKNEAWNMGILDIIVMFYTAPDESFKVPVLFTWIYFLSHCWVHCIVNCTCVHECLLLYIFIFDQYYENVQTLDTHRQTLELQCLLSAFIHIYTHTHIHIQNALRG